MRAASKALCARVVAYIDHIHGKKCLDGQTCDGQQGEYGKQVVS